jgi:hypothetical protein
MSKNGAPRLSDEASFCIHLQEEARVAWRCVHHVPQRSLQKSSWGWATGGWVEETENQMWVGYEWFNGDQH